MSFSTNPPDSGYNYQEYQGSPVKLEEHSSSNQIPPPSINANQTNLSNSSSLRKSPQKLNIHENYFNSTDDDESINSGRKSVKSEQNDSEDIKSEFSYTRTIPDLNVSRMDTSTSSDSNGGKRSRESRKVKTESSLSQSIETLSKNVDEKRSIKDLQKSKAFEEMPQPNKSFARMSRESYMSSISNYSGSVVDATAQSVPIAYVNDSDPIENTAQTYSNYQEDNDNKANSKFDLKNSLSRKFLKRNSTTDSKQSNSTISNSVVTSVVSSVPGSVKTPMRTTLQTSADGTKIMASASSNSTGTASQSGRSSNKKFSHSKTNSLTSSIPEENDTSSIVFGKLISNTQVGQGGSNQLTPSKEEIISIEPTLPSRSQRRPRSTIILTDEDSALQSPSSKNRMNRYSDMTGLKNQSYDMSRYDSQVVSQRSHSPKKDSISTQVLKDLRNSASAASYATGSGSSSKQRPKSTNVSQSPVRQSIPVIDLTSPIPKISSALADGLNKSGTSINSNESYHTASKSGNNSNVSINGTPQSPTKLPPRPSKDKLDKAREASLQLSIDLDKKDSPTTEVFKESPETKYDAETDYDYGYDYDVGKNKKNYKTKHNEANDDNDYIDIIETPKKGVPEPLKKSKSSKKISHHKRKSSSKLKPFTYSTLVKLLESTNGTIIGEEFDHLKLPVKEKQLIEKIVDALSRLSADMVLDDNRYEIGLVRLEKALRVLEGFL